jgi:hypothetical protein
VQVPLRISVVQLPNNNGFGDSLLVYNPLSATRELISWVQQSERHYNAPVRHTVLGSIAAEHKNKSAANMTSTTAKADTRTAVADWMDHLHYKILDPLN